MQAVTLLIHCLLGLPSLDLNIEQLIGSYAAAAELELTISVS